jgi:DNA-binding response OmpR family regulator
VLTNKRLLIIEEEFLIALDIQRVVEDAHAMRTVFARNFGEASALADHFEDFDLAIVTSPRQGTSDEVVAERLANAGPAIVVCSATPASVLGTKLETAELVSKPFADGELLEACRRALAKRSSRTPAL